MASFKFWNDAQTFFTRLVMPTPTADNTITVPEGTYTVAKSENPTFSGKIQGDFSNATLANRTMLQTSTPNGHTVVEAIPNGTSQISYFIAGNSQDPANNSHIYMSAQATETIINSGARGTGSPLPISFKMQLVEKARLDTLGNFLVTGAGGLGYGTGSGGTVTQATSKSTAVTLNKPTGQITMNNAALAAGATVVFALLNNTISASDVVLVTYNFNSTSYNVWVNLTQANSCQIALKNISAGSLSEAVVINFAVIKGAIA